jgi:hypothetical protein
MRLTVTEFRKFQGTKPLLVALSIIAVLISIGSSWARASQVGSEAEVNCYKTDDFSRKIPAPSSDAECNICFFCSGTAELPVPPLVRGISLPPVVRRSDACLNRSPGKLPDITSVRICCTPPRAPPRA